MTLSDWGNQMTLTLMPSNRDRALRGLRARRVLRDLMGPRSEYPMALAVKLTSETYNTCTPSLKEALSDTTICLSLKKNKKNPLTIV